MTLSDKIYGGLNEHLDKEDVKEFIKELKERFKDLNAVQLYNQNEQIIDKLAGDDLI